MKLAQRTTAVAPSATLAMTARAKAMRADGIDVLALSAGEPDFDTPENVARAAHEAIDRGDTRYAPVAGTIPLRKALAEHYGTLYGRDLAPENTIAGAGGKQILFNACVCLLDPGDEAVFPAPYWVSYPDMVRFAGAEPVVVKTGAEQGFLPTVDQLAAAFTAKTRLLLLNSPSNPTGATYSREQLEGIAELLRQHPDVFVITDDIYYTMVYDGEFVSIAHVAPDLADRMLIATGVSKAYAMTGWRVGVGIGPVELIKAMTRIQGASTSGANTVALAAALEAITGPQDAVTRMTAAFEARRDRMVDALREIPDLTVPTPGGAFYVFPRVDAYYSGKIADSQAMCEHLLESVHLAAVPGGAFGSDAYIRLSFACSDEDIDEGVRRLRTGLEALR
jgi:aspartate aminotransferase